MPAERVDPTLPGRHAGRRRATSPRYSVPNQDEADPEARVMKMGDGGFRLGMNVQVATAGDVLGGPRTIVGVAARGCEPRQSRRHPRTMLCELTSANARRMGMTQLLVRVIEKATGFALLTAIAHDVLVHAATLLTQPVDRARSRY